MLKFNTGNFFVYANLVREFRLYSCRDGGVWGFSYLWRARVSLVISVFCFWFSSFSCLSCWHVAWQFLLIVLVVVWQLIFVVVCYCRRQTYIKLSIDNCMLWFMWEEKLKLTKMVYV